MDRPHATDQRRSAEAVREVARLKAAHAAAVARRGAAARRRGALATVLVLATVGGWIAFATAPAMSLAVGLVPTGLLAAVVGLGRRAVVAGHRHDEEWFDLVARAERGAGEARPVSAPVPATSRTASSGAASSDATADGAATDGTAARRPLRTASGPARPHADLETSAVPMAPAEVVGRAVHPSQTITDVFDVIVADRGENGAAARHATGATPVVSARAGAARTGATSEPAEDDGAWSPVPVPLPTYALKPAAPHREPAPLGDLEPEPAVAEAVDETEAAQPQTTGSIDLDAVLARRRASGM